MPIQSFPVYVIPYSDLRLGDTFIIMDATRLTVPESFEELMPFVCVRSDTAPAGWHTLFCLPDRATGMPLSSWKLPDETLVMRVR